MQCVQIIPIKIVAIKPNHNPALENAKGMASIPDPRDPLNK